MTVRYFDAGPLPILFGVCLSEKDFRREIRRLGVREEVRFLNPGCGGQAMLLESTAGQYYILICFDAEECRDRPRNQVVGLIAHEATHAMQYAVEAMRDDEPSNEMQAYLVQWFTQCALSEYEKVASR